LTFIVCSLLIERQGLCDSCALCYIILLLY